jgi:hypothetical protein
MTTFSQITPQCTVVADARPAPINPPMSAWDDEEGSPNHQVTRFQVMAPRRPESTTTSPWLPSGMLMIPLPIVFATPSPSRAPMRLKIAAMSSATRGVRAPVETDVAIALAASWKPLV